MKKDKQSLREVYQSGIAENLPARLLRVIILLPIECIFWSLGVMLARTICAFALLGVKMQYKDIFAEKTAISFINNIYDAMGVFFFHILLFTILRVCVKFKTHYIDMILMLAISSIIVSPALFNRGSGPILNDLGFWIASVILFATITFGAFSAAIALLDKRTALKDWIKILISVAAGVIGGLAISRLIWIPIIAIYLR
ncbi:MAG: hypothetical protein LBN00_09545 [Oscillospiraceae bacterium]|jgi:hypothetical protein|nr:hypothetical protein [Oscillospiraceae bacterium]